MSSDDGCTSMMLGGPGSSGGRPCGACKYLRRKCLQSGCILAPYFESEHGAADFAPVHKVFGARTVSKILLQIPAHKRLDAVDTICYEAQARLRDPVYGCVAHIVALQHQVLNLQAELTYLQTHLQATPELLSSPQPLAAPQMPMVMPALPSSTTSDLFGPPAQPHVALQQHHQHQLRQPSYGASSSSMAEGWADGRGDLNYRGR